MMVKRKEFDDPLNEIDPVMNQAFSGTASKVESAEVQQDSGSYNVSNVEFPDLTETNVTESESLNQNVFKNIPVTVSVELGRSQISLKEVLDLSEGSIVELQRLVGEPLDLVVNGQIIAQGEVVAIDNNYGLRITNVIARSS